MGHLLEIRGGHVRVTIVIPWASSDRLSSVMRRCRQERLQLGLNFLRVRLGRGALLVARYSTWRWGFGASLARISGILHWVASASAPPRGEKERGHMLSGASRKWWWLVIGWGALG
jgi:hypothetical protein